MHEERRKEKRQHKIIPIRYRMQEDPIFTVSDVVDFTDDGFCMMMPIELGVGKEFQFETFDGQSSTRGKARVIWMGNGHLKAGCTYTKN